VRNRDVTELERFKAVAHFEKPDYVPVFGFEVGSSLSAGCMKRTHERLIATGMPDHVGGVWRIYDGVTDVESWCRYWGTSVPIDCPIRLARGTEGFKETRRIEGACEIIESESGAVRRQVIDNDITYSMPEFVEYPVRDRESWEFYRRRMTPADKMPADEMEEHCRQYDDRERPLMIVLLGVQLIVREAMGLARCSLAMYDDPELVHEMAAWHLAQVRETTFPLIERLRPEIVLIGEDACYNHGMFFSAEHFREFCGTFYGELCDLCRASAVDLIAIDNDGNCTEFIEVVEPYGVNCLFPCEAKAGNDLSALRERYPGFVFGGWLEKEVVNEGNGRLIREEVLSKAPPLLEKGGYFPNIDHGLQEPVTFENLCAFMTLLHEVTGNPEGEFPRC